MKNQPKTDPVLSEEDVKQLESVDHTFESLLKEAEGSSKSRKKKRTIAPLGKTKPLGKISPLAKTSL